MYIYTYPYIHIYTYVEWVYILTSKYCHAFFDGYCSTVQGLLGWFEVDLGFIRAFIFSNRFVCSVCICSPLVLFWTFCTASPARWECL